MTRHPFDCAVTRLVNLRSIFTLVSIPRFNLLGDGPHEAGELTCDGHDDLVAVHAARGEPAKTRTQAHLGFPADRADVRVDRTLALRDVPGDARREAIGVRGLDQRPARGAVAGLGDAALPSPRA